MFIAAGLSLHCSMDLASGGSSEVEGITISGRVVGPDITPLPGVAVSLFSHGRLYQFDSAEIQAYTTVTGQDGLYTFKKIDTGQYTLRALSGDSSRTAIRSAIAVSSSDTLADLALDRSSTVRGVVPSGFPYSSAKGVMIFGTPFRNMISADGSFSIAGVAAGTYTIALILAGANGIDVVGALDTIRVAPGTSVELDSIRIPLMQSGLAGAVAIDDFSDCNIFNLAGGAWWSCNDKPEGNSTVSLFEIAPVPGETAGHCAVHLSFVFGHASPGPFVGTGTHFLPFTERLHRCLDMRKAIGISFRLKGSGAGLEALLQSDVSGLVSDQGFTIAQVPVAWTSYTFAIPSDMTDTFDSTDVRCWRLRSRAITHLQFDAFPAGAADSGEIWIDSVRIVFP